MRQRWMKGFRSTASIVLLLYFVLPAFAAMQTGQLKGTVTGAGPDDQPIFLVSAAVTVRSPVLPSGILTTLSDDNGEFLVTGLEPGQYSVTVRVEGFKEATQVVDIRAAARTDVRFQLEIAQLAEEVEITAKGEQLDKTESTQRTEIAQREITYAPLVSEKFQDTLPLIPGVVRGPDGLINIKGARSNVSGLLVNSASATDAVTGESGISLPIDAVESVEVLTSPYLAEYGKFAGGVTSVETKSGGDKWRVEFNNFFPRARRREDPFTGKSALAGIESWTPRLRLSGPLKKDRLILAQTVQYKFVRTKVDVLPDPQEPPVVGFNWRGEVERDTQLESLDSFTELNYRLNRKNDVRATLSIYPQNNLFVNLDSFNPPLVAPNFRQRGFQLAVTERAFITPNVVLESLFSFKRFNADVFPNGLRPMIFTPEVNTGSYFNRQERDTDRYEVVETLSYQPSVSHLFKFGVNVARTSFDGLNESRPVHIVRASGPLGQLIEFVGGPLIGRDTTEFTAFAQDKWLVNRKLTFDLGLRYDRETIADENLFAPRFGFVIVPANDNRTAIRGGIGLFWGKMQLNVGTFDQVQQRIVTLFGPSGLTPLGPARRFVNVIGSGAPETPYSVSWNVEVDRQLAPGLTLRVGYLQRDGRRELIINPFENSTDPARGILELSNGGRSRYREFQVTGRYNFGEANTIFVSYARSAATGDLNSFNEFFGNFENPIIRPNEVSRLPFDSPNRFLVWGNLELPWKITLFPVLDVHDGFPFSIIDEDRNFIGRRNRAGRFPVFASLDMKISKRFNVKFKGNKYEVDAGVKIFNLTDHFNPRNVQNNVASRRFGDFLNSVGPLVRGTFQIRF